MSFLKKFLPRKKASKRLLFIVVSLFLFIPIFCLLLYNVYFWGLIFPNVYVAGNPVSAKSPAQASIELSQKVKVPETIKLVGEEVSFEIDTKELGVTYDFEESSNYAFSLTRTGNIFYDLAKEIELLFKPAHLGLRLSLDEKKLEEALMVVAGQSVVDPVYPSVKIVDGKAVVEKGSPGSELDIKLLSAQIGKTLAMVSSDPIKLPVKTVDPSISEDEAAVFALRAEVIKDKSLTAKFEFQNFSYKGNTLLAFLDPSHEYSDPEIDKAVNTIASSVDREPQDSVFVFEAGRVNEFTPSKDGIVVKKETLKDMLKGNLRTLETSAEPALALNIPVEAKAPKIQTGEVNNLGIKELIGRGSSRYTGSIPNRIYNISLASSRFKGVLVAPGETFSFNNVLGDVSSFTGYKQAYVIKDGKTVLGDGGGVCQVSTTLFRAILNAGLPVIERRPHSYRVGYYEQDAGPGLDATVFAPTTDLKFKNDTPGHILIQPIVNTKAATLVFEIYGTSDGRIASTTKPVVSGVTAPPEDLYVDDPTLPAGTVKQIEHKAWGAKAVFNYKVVRDGETIYEKTFSSAYRPWQAVFLRGTGPAQ